MRVPSFYPVVPTADWVRRLAPIGVKIIQLRIKDAPREHIRREIADSLAACAASDCTLVVNDYWSEAIELGATFVHLGQDDARTANLAELRQAQVRIGISTHDEAELEAALAIRPDYVALGPIYETTLKAMPWAPQGLARIREWKLRVGALPLVAIGGISLERAPAVVAAGADSVAVVSDIVASPDAETRTLNWLGWSQAFDQSYSAQNNVHAHYGSSQMGSQ